MTKDEFLQKLYQREQRDTQARFRIDLPEDQAAYMLAECYKAEVRKRGRNPTIDRQTHDAIQRIAKWLTMDGKKIGLMLYGTVGNGKTTMARSICELIGLLYSTNTSSTSISVKQISAFDLANLCSSQTDAKMAADAESRFNLFRGAPLLYIDDLGAEPAVVRSWGNNLRPLVDILYHRYDNQLFTIVTTNQDDKKLLETYDVRIADRIREMFDRLPYTHQSYR